MCTAQGLYYTRYTVIKHESPKRDYIEKLNEARFLEHLSKFMTILTSYFDVTIQVFVDKFISSSLALS